jgi:hypothetical protein
MVWMNWRMRIKPYHWLVTYLYAVSILHQYGERAWPPRNVRFVWKMAKETVDEVFPVGRPKA